MNVEVKVTPPTPPAPKWEFVLRLNEEEMCAVLAVANYDGHFPNGGMYQYGSNEVKVKRTFETLWEAVPKDVRDHFAGKVK